MDAIDVQKVNCLIDLINEMILQLNKHSNLETHRRIDDSFYLQKIVELRLLGDQLEEARQHVALIQHRVNEYYYTVYCKWKSDAHWLHDYVRKLPIL